VLVYLKNEVGSVYCNERDEVMFNPFCNDDSVRDSANKPVIINAGDPNIVKLALKLPDKAQTKKSLTIEQLRALIQQKCIYTANNTLFLKHEVKWGVIAKWCEYFYSLRKSTKKKMLACTHKLHNEASTLSEEEKS